MANPINPPHTNRKKRKKRKVFNRNQLESNIKREEVINKLRWYPQQRVHFFDSQNLLAFFPKTWFSKPKLLNLTSALWNLHLQNPPNRPHTSRKLTLEVRVQYIRNLPLSDGNLRNPMCEHRPHGQPGNQEVRRVEFTKAYRLGKKKHFPPKTNALTSLTLGITPQKNHAKALLQPKDKTSPNHPDFV